MINSTTYKWLVNKTNAEYVDYVARTASVSPAFAQVLINRGIKTPDQLNFFLNPEIGKLSDPFELPDIKIVIDRIHEAKRLGERVLICGDYDADGVTSTAIMMEGLKRFGVDADYFIPDRLTHGYGFGTSGVEKAKETGARLIITVDCGIMSFDAVSQANALAIDVIITDHHEPMRQLAVSGQSTRLCRQSAVKGEFIVPDALAIVNPKLFNSLTPQLLNLSGAGVAFKLMQALFENNIDDVYALLDLAAIGIAADVVPVVGDNRIILKEGIKSIQSGERIGIRALKQAAGIKSDFFKTTFLYYTLIPRINAAGRIANAADVVRLLTTGSEAEAESLAKWLNELNSKRQEIEQVVYNEAKEMLNTLDASRSTPHAIVLASEGWHPGVVGIVASRIAEEYYRPTFILSIENGMAKGSARSIPAFDIYDGLTKCKELLKRFGGHKQAAGLSLLSEDVARFREMILGIVSDAISDDDRVPALHIDAAVSMSDVTIDLINEISLLEPFGCGNDEPLFGGKGLEVMQPRVVGKNHLKMRLKQNGRSVDSIGFDFGGLLDVVENVGMIDAAFHPVINEWNSEKYVQLNLKAIRPVKLNNRVRP